MSEQYVDSIMRGATIKVSVDTAIRLCAYNWETKMHTEFLCGNFLISEKQRKLGDDIKKAL